MIHSTAIIEKGAEIDLDVQIGPYAFVGDGVKIKSGTNIMHHASVTGDTKIGHDVVIHPFASVGGVPQDLKYKKGEPCYAVIGDRTVIRECATVNRGSHEIGPTTTIGTDCLLMAYSHVAHNVLMGNYVVVANCAAIAGHVIIDDHAIIGGLTGIHQFCRIGKMTIIGGASKVNQDILPYMMADGNPAIPRFINKVGLERKEYSKEEIKHLKDIYKIIYREKATISNAREKILELDNKSDTIKDIISFIDNSERGIARGN